MTVKVTLKDYRDLSERFDKVEAKAKAHDELAVKLAEAEKTKADAEKQRDEFKAKMAETEAAKALAEKKGKELEDQLKGVVEGGGHPVYGNRSDSLESRCVRMFGVSHVKGLLSVNTAERRFQHAPAEMKSMVLDLKRDFDNARAISQLFYGAPTDHIGTTEDQDRVAICKEMAETRYFKEIIAPKLKAFGTGVSGGGAEWIPTAIASTYIPEVEMARELIGQFVDVQMPTSPFELPTAGSFTKARRATENTTATDSSFSTGSLNFNAKKWLEYYIFPEELNEDSAPGILELGRQQLTEAHLRAFEAAAVNGVRIGTAHIDSDFQAAAADIAEKQWNGLRYLALQNTPYATLDMGNAALTDAKCRALRAKLKKFGQNPKDLIWVVSSVGEMQMLGLDNVVTIDKAGSMATVLSGTLATYLGSPIVASGYMRDDLNASGVYDGVTMTRSSIMIVHKRRWYFGTRRPIRMAIRPARSADDRYEMASYSRNDFVGHTQGSAEIDVAIGYNMST